MHARQRLLALLPLLGLQILWQDEGNFFLRASDLRDVARIVMGEFFRSLS